MKIINTLLPGVLVIEPKVHVDNRGCFKELYNLNDYHIKGIDSPFVQDNHSRSKRGILRGLHFQKEYPQGKLVSVIRGKIFDVAVDIDASSPTFKKYVAVELCDESHRQMYIPPGYAHGFCVLSDLADIIYKCTDFYRPGDEGGVIWNDSEIGIDWPVSNPILSSKDRNNPGLKDLHK